MDICSTMTGVARQVVINRPDSNPFSVVEFFMLRETKIWKEAVKVITHTEEPEEDIVAKIVTKLNTYWNSKKSVSD